MSFVAEKGVITEPTSTGNQTYNLGSAFDGIIPKALILWTTDQTAADTVTDADSIMCMGFGTYRGSVVSQAYLSLWADDTVGTSVTCRGRGTGSIIKTFNADAAVVGSAIVAEIERLNGAANLVEQIGKFTKALLPSAA